VLILSNFYKVAIIGGGAGGLMTASYLCDGKTVSPSDIIVFEKNDRVGKKLSATGNGQGNITNKNISPENYRGESLFVAAAVDNVKSADLTDYFYKNSLPVSFDEEGRGYPVSRQANAVTDVLRAKLSYFGVTVKTETTALKIDKRGKNFTVTTDAGEYNAEYVVCAFGGKAGRVFGTDGSGYLLATSLGHKLTELFPSLVQLKAERSAIKGLSGIKVKAKVSAYDGETFLAEKTGDLLFNDYGVSGNSVFYLSAFLTDKNKPSLKVDFLPDYTEEEARKIIADKIENSHFLPAHSELLGILNKKLGELLLRNIEKRTAENITRIVKNYFIPINGNAGFDRAQVTHGGIKTSEIDEKTYESKLIDNLFIIGEALDIDGDCGGYNLAFAFSSGIACAKEINRREKP